MIRTNFKKDFVPLTTAAITAKIAKKVERNIPDSFELIFGRLFSENQTKLFLINKKVKTPNFFFFPRFEKVTLKQF